MYGLWFALYIYICEVKLKSKISVKEGYERIRLTTEITKQQALHFTWSFI